MTDLRLLFLPLAKWKSFLYKLAMVTTIWNLSFLTYRVMMLAAGVNVISVGLVVLWIFVSLVQYKPPKREHKAWMERSEPKVNEIFSSIMKKAMRE